MDKCIFLLPPGPDGMEVCAKVAMGQQAPLVVCDGTTDQERYPEWQKRKRRI